MAASPPYTLCVHTKDAEWTNEGEFVIDMGANGVKKRASRVSLASLEFPMVQWSIEEDWNRLYYSEGIRIQPDDRTLAYQIDGARREATLPLTLNRVVSWKSGSKETTVRTEFPHALFPQGKSLLPLVGWGDVELVCTPRGRVNLSGLAKQGKVRSVDDFTLAVVLTPTGSAAAPNAGYLHLPVYPCPAHLCAMLRAAAAPIAYEKETAQALLRPPPLAKQLTVETTPLSRLLGVEGATFHHASTRRNSTVRLYRHVSLTPGWYLPQQRPHVTGSPLHFADQAELSLNRFYFPLTESVHKGESTPHRLVFVDACGETRSCGIPPGKYSPTGIAAHLEHGMNAAGGTGDFAFRYDVEAGRFTVACTHGGEGVPFSVLFHHPDCTEARRFGFDPHPLTGAETYASPHPVFLPATCNANVYRVQERGHEKRFAFHAAPLPTLTGKLASYTKDGSVLAMQTYVAQLPFAHGLLPGTVVRIAPSPSTVLLADKGHGWEEEEVEGCNMTCSVWRSAVVLEGEAKEVTTLRLHVRPSAVLASCTGMCIQVQVPTAPFTLAFDPLHRSVRSHMLGFRPGALLYGEDGALLSGRGKLPPYVAPSVHALDHPDYVLMHLGEGGSSYLQHTHAGETSFPMCKIVLYPIGFREERSLPRDIAVTGSAQRLTFRFTNPDGSRYHFHGANFSFSLHLFE